MNLVESIVLGAVQGITEFLPVSSSGHLVLAQAVLGVEEPGIFLEVSTHVATLLAILVFFRRRILALLRHLRALPRLASATPEEKEGLRLVGFLVLASIPAAAVGLLLKGPIESAFESPYLVLFLLCITGAFLVSTRVAPPPSGGFTLFRALAIGVAQAAAVLPGISRSGATIGTGLHARIDGEKAAEFSFLLAVPAIAGAALLHALELQSLPAAGPAAAAFLTAGITGYAALALLVRILRRRFLWVFGLYCVTVGSAGMLFLALRTP